MSFAPPRRCDPVVEVLDGVNLAMDSGELVLVEGCSGSGKSTLLGLAGLLWRPTGGRVHFRGRDVSDDSSAYRNRLRRLHVGYVFQSYQLFERMPAWESIALPLLVRNWPLERCRRRAAELMSALGMEGREHHRTEQLSGGEQQRVAVARALAGSPELIVADEPLSNADPTSADRIITLLQDSREDGAGLLVASHDRRIAGLASRRLDLDAVGGRP